MIEAVSQRSSMLDLVRRTCDDAQGLDNFEGVYEPDPEQVAAWQESEAEVYGGELRFVNLGPQAVKRMLEANINPDDQADLENAEQYWTRAGGYAGGAMEAGYVDRGDEREAIYANSMSELAAGVQPVAAVTVGGTLRAGGIPQLSEPTEPGEYRDTGIIDWSFLLGQGELPVTEDWF